MEIECIRYFYNLYSVYLVWPERNIAFRPQKENSFADRCELCGVKLRDVGKKYVVHGVTIRPR